MGQLDTHHDRVIVFEAVRTSEVPSRLAAERQPLQPSKHQVPQKPLLPKPETPASPSSKALYKPMLDNVIAKYGLQDENAVATPHSNACLPSHYQYPYYQSPYSKGGSQSLQDIMQSAHSSIRSPQGSTRLSPINTEVHSVAPSLSNITPSSMHEPSRASQSFSSPGRNNVFNSYTAVPATQTEIKKVMSPLDKRKRIPQAMTNPKLSMQN